MNKNRFLLGLLWVVLIAVILGISGLYFLQNKQVGKVTLPLGQVGRFSLTNQSGKITSSDDLQGKVTVYDVIFTRCPVQCIRMTRNMAATQKLIGPAEDVRFVSLTADPDNDTPEVLSLYGRKYGADQTQWLFLTGTRRELNKLAVEGLKLVLLEKGEKEREIPEDLFVHSPNFVVVDKKGGIRGWFDGSEETVISKVSILVQELRKESP